MSSVYIRRTRRIFFVLVQLDNTIKLFDANSAQELVVRHLQVHEPVRVGEQLTETQLTLDLALAETAQRVQFARLRRFEDFTTRRTRERHHLGAGGGS